MYTTVLTNKSNQTIKPKGGIHFVSILWSLAVVIFFVFKGLSLFECFSFGLFAFFVLDFIQLTSIDFPIKHLAAMIYIINYLVAPSIMYMQENLVDDIYTDNYAMKLDIDTYYSIALPSIISLILGLFSVRSNLQSYQLKNVPNFSHVTGFVLFVIVCIFLRILYSDTIFFIFLVAQLRYVLTFYLFFQVSKRFIWLLLAVMGVDLVLSLQTTLFQNLIIWVIFFIMLFIQSNKYSLSNKIFIYLLMIISLVFMQKTKIETRNSFRNANSEEIDLNDASFASNVIVRMNQGWILASAVERVERTKDFQDFTLVNLYLENALSARVINKDKYLAQSDLFNRFSGHDLSQGSSMSLGIIADGYLSFRLMGAILFSFIWGWLIAYIIKIFDTFMRQDEIYFYLVLIVLFYMIRPDTQVALAFNHLVKSMILIIAFYIVRLSMRRTVINNG